MSNPENDYTAWLIEHSMLEAVRSIAARYSGQGSQWRNPYAEARPRAASALASVWFTAYPGSIITRDGESVLETLGDEALWRTFADIGIQAIHTGPMKQAGGLSGREFTPTIDGHFDRIGVSIDPQFGTAGRIRRDQPQRGRAGRGGHRRYHPRPHGQRPRLPPGRAGLCRLPRPLPHGSNCPRGLASAAGGAGRPGFGESLAGGSGHSQG